MLVQHCGCFSYPFFCPHLRSEPPAGPLPALTPPSLASQATCVSEPDPGGPMWLKPSLISHSSWGPLTTHLSKGCSAFQGGTLQGPRSLHLATLGQPHSSSPAAGLPTSALRPWSPLPTRGQGHFAKMALVPTGNRVLHGQVAMGLSDLCATPPWPHWPLAVPPEPSQGLCSCCPPAHLGPRGPPLFCGEEQPICCLFPLPSGCGTSVSCGLVPIPLIPPPHMGGDTGLQHRAWHPGGAWPRWGNE